MRFPKFEHQKSKIPGTAAQNTETEKLEKETENGKERLLCQKVGLRHQNRVRPTPRMSTSTTPLVEELQEMGRVAALHPRSPQTVLLEVEHQAAEVDKKLRALQAKTRRLAEEQAQIERKKRSLTHFIEQHPTAPVEVQPPAKRRRGQPISNEVKALIREKVYEKEEMTWKEAAEAYNVHHSSIGRIVHAARAHEFRQQALALHNPSPPPAATKQRRGRKPALGGEELVTILEWIEDNPALTLKQIVARIKNELHKNVSKSTVERTFESLDVSYKETVRIPAKWNTEAVIRARQEYVTERVRDFVGRPLVFVDECPFNLHVVSSKGRATRGEPARLTVLPKQKNITYIGAMARTGIIYHKFVASRGEAKRGVDADDFRLFLLDLAPHLPESAVVLMDNAPTHHTEAVERTMDDLRRQGFAILFLPPYSPFLNPIEYAFSKMKRSVRAATFHNREELREAIVRAAAEVTATDAADWFLHMVQFFRQCSEGLEFTGRPLAPTLSKEATVAQQVQWATATGATVGALALTSFKGGVPARAGSDQG